MLDEWALTNCVMINDDDFSSDTKYVTIEYTINLLLKHTQINIHLKVH